MQAPLGAPATTRHKNAPPSESTPCTTYDKLTLKYYPLPPYISAIRFFPRLVAFLKTLVLQPLIILMAICILNIRVHT